MDCSIIALRQKGLFMISTTDFFYPLVTDPYVQGMIGCCNVLSDLYAMGVPDCDTMLMLLAASTQMQEEERLIVTRRMIEGFNAKATEAGTVVSGGQTVKNPWPIIGGTATAVCSEEEFIRPEHVVPGDVYWCSPNRSERSWPSTCTSGCHALRSGRRSSTSSPRRRLCGPSLWPWLP